MQVTAFNFPVAVYGWNLALSFITGNATIWKPAPTTPLTAIATTKIIQEVLAANKLNGALSGLLCGGGDVGEALVNDKRVDLLSFTGSEARGREVSMKVAGRFGQSLLELGGNNAAIVLADANMDLALRAITFAAVGTSGQRCTSTRRLFLESSISEKFIQSLINAYKSVSARTGHPLDPNTLVGPVHTADTVKRYEAAIKEAQEQGGEVLVGGKVVKMKGELSGGNYVEPTIILVRDREKCKVMQRETFAPSEFCSVFRSSLTWLETRYSLSLSLSLSFDSFDADMYASRQSSMYQRSRLSRRLSS